jgi:hypothetical protein
VLLSLKRFLFAAAFALTISACASAAPVTPHKNLTGADLHVACYIQTSSPGAVGAGMCWYDTTTPATPVLNLRNASNTGWNIVSGGGGGSGTVTSVAASGPGAELTVTGSPVTGSGTLQFNWGNETAFTVFTRASGTGIPSFQLLTPAWFTSAGAGDNGKCITQASASTFAMATCGAGTLTASGPPTNGQIAQWTTATNVTGVAQVSVAQGGTALASGTSGGVLAYTAAGTLASSGVLTANAPVIGGGAGVVPTVGTRSGNTTSFGTTSGTLTSGDCVKFDANGNLVDNGSTCGGVSSGATGNKPIYTGATTIGPATPVATKVTGYTITGVAGDNYILVDATAGAFNVTLPAATGSGNAYTIKVVTSSANAVTVLRAGSDTIQGATSFVMSTTQWSVITLTDYVSGKWGVDNGAYLTVSGPPVAAQYAKWTTATNLQGVAIPFSDLTGKAGLAQGGGNFDFTTSGGTNQAVWQETAAGNFTVRQINQSDVNATFDPSISFMREDFTHSNFPSLPGAYNDFNLAVVTTGTLVQGGFVAGHPGVLTIGTAAGAAAGGNISNVPAATYTPGSGAITCEWDVQVTALRAAGAQEVNLTAGLADAIPSTGFGRATIRYVSATSVNWIAEVGTSGGNTSTASNVAVGIGWHKLKVIINAASTSTQFFVDGTELNVSPITTTQIGSGSTGIGPVFEYYKTLGTTTYTANVDYVMAKQTGLTR